MTPTSTPRPQISPSEGETLGRHSNAATPFYKVLTGSMIAGAALAVEASRTDIRTTACDRDGNPEGRDGATGSVRSMTARSEGVAHD